MKLDHFNAASQNVSRRSACRFPDRFINSLIPSFRFLVFNIPWFLVFRFLHSLILRFLPAKHVRLIFSYLSSKWLWVKIIDIQKIGPPIILAILDSRTLALLKPKRAISTVWKYEYVKNDNIHITWSQPVWRDNDLLVNKIRHESCKACLTQSKNSNKNETVSE